MTEETGKRNTLLWIIFVIAMAVIFVPALFKPSSPPIEKPHLQTPAIHLTMQALPALQKKPEPVVHEVASQLVLSESSKAVIAKKHAVIVHQKPATIKPPTGKKTMLDRSRVHSFGAPQPRPWPRSGDDGNGSRVKAEPQEPVPHAWMVYVGVFSHDGNVRRLRAKLRHIGVIALNTSPVSRNSMLVPPSVRLTVGPLPSKAAAVAMQHRIAQETDLKPVVRLVKIQQS